MAKISPTIDEPPERPAGSTNGVHSLLDVVVPFVKSGLQNGHQSLDHDSLLSRIDHISRNQSDIEAEKRAVDHAELRAKRAEFEKIEQLARLEAERDASIRFEEKAGWLAGEIDRVRDEKHRGSEATRVEPAIGTFQPTIQQPWSAQPWVPPYVAAPQPAPLATYPPQPYPPYPYSGSEVSPSAPAAAPIPTATVPLSAPQPAAPQQVVPQPVAMQPAPQPAVPQPIASQPLLQPAALQPVAPPPAPAAAVPPEPDLPIKAGNNNSPHGGAGPIAASMDVNAIIWSVIGAWKLIIILALAGGLVGAVIAKSMPDKFQAWAELLIDPRDLKLLDSQLVRSGFGGETMIAYLESQLRIIESNSVLNAVIDDQKLMADPEFTGASTGLLSSVFGLLSGSNEVQNSGFARQKVLRSLQKKLTIFRGSRTFIVSIGVRTGQAQKSADIVNAFAKAYVEGESSAQSRLARRASESLEDKLSDLRMRVEMAEQAVEGHKVEFDLVSNDGKLTDEVQLSQLNENLAAAKIDAVSAKTRMELARQTDLSNVISGALPTELDSDTISQLRVRYASLKSADDRLATTLGSRHPQRIATRAELASLRNQIAVEIRRLIAGSTKDYERARKRQINLTAQVNTLKLAAAGSGGSRIKLRELERELDVQKQVFENYLLRTRETSEQEGLTPSNARVITKAEPPSEKIGPRRKLIAGLGVLAGAMLGILFALFSAMARAFMDKDNSAPRVVTAETPVGGTNDDGLYGTSGGYQNLPPNPYAQIARNRQRLVE